jgi:hypothetical protein
MKIFLCGGRFGIRRLHAEYDFFVKRRIPDREKTPYMTPTIMVAVFAADRKIFQ